MIRIKDLNFTYPGADSPILKHVNLQIEKGDFLAIVGNNGCGKSTLCKTLNGLIPHFIAGDFEGEVQVGGVNTLDTGIGTLAKIAGYVYQDFENQIVRPTVLDDASFACLNYAMEDYVEKGRVALKMCGLETKEKEYIWQLSGGQKHLLALAGMLALGPEVLILDEPIAQLDPAHAGKIYDVLKNLNEEYGKTIIVIEHHTEFIGKYCRNVVLMKEGQVLWKKPAGEALRCVEELEENNIYPPQVTQAAFRMKKKGLLGSEIPLPVNVEEAAEIFRGFSYERVQACKQDQIYQIDRSHQSVPENKAEAIISLKRVSVEHRSVKGGPVKTFDNFNLDICRGDKVALVGSNGAGKSTMMKLIMGLIKPSDGEILVRGKNLKEMKTEELSSMVSIVYQNPEEMFIQDSIRKDIAYAMKERDVADYEKRTEELLEMFRLKELADRDGRLMSGGQMRRASLAIGIALNPGILMLDEPTANLDIATRKEIMKTLNVLKDVTETVIIATHDMQLVCEWADRIIVLSHGYLITDGGRDQVFQNTYAITNGDIRPPEIYLAGQAICPYAQVYTVDEFVNAFRRGGEYV